MRGLGSKQELPHRVVLAVQMLPAGGPWPAPSMARACRAAEAEAEAEATTSTEQDEHGDADGRAPRLRSDESYALVLGSDVMCVCPSFVSARSPQRLCFRIATPTACSSSLLSADVSRIRIHRRRTSVGDELGDSWMRDPHIQRAV